MAARIPNIGYITASALPGCYFESIEALRADVHMALAIQRRINAWKKDRDDYALGTDLAEMGCDNEFVDCVLTTGARPGTLFVASGA